MSELQKAVLEALRAGTPAGAPTREQYVDWAYAQAKLENHAVTREMAERAVERMFRDDK